MRHGNRAVPSGQCPRGRSIRPVSVSVTVTHCASGRYMHSCSETSGPSFVQKSCYRYVNADQTEQDPRGIDGLLGGDGGAIEGGSQVAPRAMRAGLLPAADAKILAMLTDCKSLHLCPEIDVTHTLLTTTNEYAVPTTTIDDTPAIKRKATVSLPYLPSLLTPPSILSPPSPAPGALTLIDLCRAEFQNSPNECERTTLICFRRTTIVDGIFIMS